ncbi:MAG: beta-galactosidase [Acutalibacteraceae bacterium]
MQEFFLGSSYYPEWWTESEWEEDFAKMEALGFNTVRMGEFAWSWYEPTEGNYNFAPMLRALDCAQKHHIKVVMGTTTAIAPPWLYKKYPEIKGGNIHGHYDFGGRKGQCLSSEIFLEYAKKITKAQTEALGTHPAIVGWQLDNEPGFPFWDFDENCNIGFRKWLREKYGTIDALNKTWFTMLWSNVYNDFDEIQIPVNLSEGGWSPQVQLDYRRYFSFTFNRLLSMEAEYVRKNSPGRFIYTNWPGANWSVNCFDGEKYLDYAGWDNYVPQPFGDDYRIQLRASMEHSFDRRLSNGKNEFLVAEQKAYADADANAQVIAAQTWLNISHGAFGTFYFEWRTPNGSFEQGYDGILAKDKNYRPDTKPVFEKLAQDIRKIYPLIRDGRTRSDIAILYSYENSWGMQNWVVDGYYDDDFFNCYGGFKNALQTNIDVVGMQDDLSGYKIVVLPNHRITTAEEAEKIKAYVQNGGTVILDCEAGTRDENNQTRELLPPGLFAELCGCKVFGSVSADDLRRHTGDSSVRFADGTVCAVHNTVHALTAQGAQTVAAYTSGRLSGTPAVTIHPYGKGFAILYGFSGNDIGFYEALAKDVQKRFHIQPLLSAEDGVIVSSRTANGKEYIFAVNMKDAENAIYPVGKAVDLLSGKQAEGKYILAPYQTAVLQVQ